LLARSLASTITATDDLGRRTSPAAVLADKHIRGETDSNEQS
jgi:hypothetical protein